MMLFDGFPYEFSCLLKLVNACGPPKNIVKILKLDLCFFGQGK